MFAFSSVFLYQRGMISHIDRGTPYPLGATQTPKGVNFAVFYENDDQVRLRLIDPHHLTILNEIDVPFRTGQIRHCELGLNHLPIGYQYVINDQLLSDPYAKAVLTPQAWGKRNIPYNPISLLLPTSTFDWGGVNPPKIAKEELILYEMHVRGFTQDDSSGVNSPGTFLGMIDKIDYLKSLGINAVELMPIHEFDENEYPPKNAPPLPLYQYFGYSSVNFFSLMNRYASTNAPGAVIDEFKLLVRELHRAGIEIILDVVFNHSAEGNAQSGPIYSYKSLGSSVYYLHQEDGDLANYSGCGNTLNCNHPVMIQLILDSLKYFVSESQIDGFRFDLTSILCRGSTGELLARPPLIQAITRDPLLSSVKLIAEPWDAAGAFQLGDFALDTPRWGEWNSYYRDDVRRFIRGHGGSKGKFATRLAGSEDLFGHGKKQPKNSINFITCHDGFSLRDLVTYNEKHNLANGEHNRDGMNHNDSWNCGVEGSTSDPDILALRERQMKNFHLALMLSHGTPMLFMGDEYGHSKEGNNNTWCQDNRLNWMHWNKLDENEGFYRFYKSLIAFRNAHPLLKKSAFFKQGDIEWHGTAPYKPHWNQEDQFLAFTLYDYKDGHDIYAAFNASPQFQEVEIPAPRAKKWHWVANTALPSPDDFKAHPLPIETEVLKYRMAPYSSLLLKGL
jgi:isoamylase